jgi:Subtilase family
MPLARRPTRLSRLHWAMCGAMSLSMACAQAAVVAPLAPPISSLPSRNAANATASNLPIATLAGTPPRVSAPPTVIAPPTATPSATNPATAATQVPVGVAAPLEPPPPSQTSGSAPQFAAPAFNSERGAAGDDEPAFEFGQVLVLWTSSEMATQGIATLQQRYQLRPRQRYSLPNLGLVVAMLALPSAHEAENLRDTLRAEQPDWVVDLNARSGVLQSSSDSTAPRLYAQKMLGWTATQPTPPLLRLGVVDTALDASTNLANALNGSTLQTRSVLPPSDKPAASNHGNAVLQLIAGASNGHGFAGSAPAIHLLWASVMREINGKPSTNSLLLALALDWLVAQHVNLINMSLGGQGDQVLQMVVNKVLAQHIAIVAAVGNTPDRTKVYPAAYQGVWAVTAVDAQGQLYGQATHADYTSFAAPGVELWIPDHNGGAYVSGTSYATALSSAVLAWQPASFWALSDTQRRDHICAHAAKIAAEEFSGCGLIHK